MLCGKGMSDDLGVGYLFIWLCVVWGGRTKRVEEVVWEHVLCVSRDLKVAIGIVIKIRYE